MKKLMKTTLCFILTLLIFMMLTLVSTSFAQDASNEYIVRVIYFLPKDHTSSKNIDEKMDRLIKDVQEFYADQMDIHGFGRKTFRLETDNTGRVVVHRVSGNFDTAYYAGNNDVHYMCSNIAPEIREQFASNHIYLAVTDFTQPLGGYALGDVIVITPTPQNVDNIITVGDDEFIMTAHELGHSFGLGHDFRNDAYIMSYGHYPDRLSKCAARWLDAHRFFNTPNAKIDTNAAIQMLSPTLAPPDGIRLRFEVNDPDGLHQAHLLIPTHSFDLAWGFKLDGCHFFEHDNDTTIEFVSTGFIEETQNLVSLYVIDKQGDITGEFFPIDISGIEPPEQYVSISDPNLAVSLRQALKLGKNEPIPLRKMQVIKYLDLQDNQIKSLAGLEHAVYLGKLCLGDNDGNFATDNDVSDLTPLKNLTTLSQLWLQHNNVSDLTPLESLTDLRDLSLFDNAVSDLTPLKNLTELIWLNLGRNPVSDLTPLKNLTKLQWLDLYFSNNVNDITVLGSMPKLKNLTLGGTTISDSDLMHLKNLTELKRLSLDYTNIGDITHLKNLAELEHLSLNATNVSDITVLANMPKLTTLSLSNTNISDITPLLNLTKLKYLDLSDNNISDITPLLNLTNLETLRLEGNPIKNPGRILTLLRRNPDIKIYLKAGGDPLPVSLSHFRAERTDAGVLVKWITESEVDNAGFYIYRSETKDSEFKIVNPQLIQGAGTTSERNEYTWTDTTAKPNTVYYYRIEDVSHAGVRKSLATVRMRGLVSASGKLTVRWADLKAQD